MSPKLEMQRRKDKMWEGSVSAGCSYENHLTHFSELKAQQSMKAGFVEAHLSPLNWLSWVPKKRASHL